MARKPQFVPQGIRHATINGHRFHLRLTDPTKDNYLWIDGKSPPLILDQIAAEFLGEIIEAMWHHQMGSGDHSGDVRRQVVDRMYQRYGNRFAIGRNRVTRKRINDDLDRIFGTLMTAAEGGCPLEAGLETQIIQHDAWGAPARMDLALTYRCNLDCGHCYAGGSQEGEELTTTNWLNVYEALWGIGVPQVVFTGGEPTLRDDLVELVSEADEFVTGLVTNGTNLKRLAKPLRDASLDYVQVTLESRHADVHNRMVGSFSQNAHEQTVEGIQTALDLGMEVVTNTTLTMANVGEFAELLEYGKKLGLKDMACNSLICSGRGKAASKSHGVPLDHLTGILKNAQQVAVEIGINLQWYTPTCYHQLNPLELGFGPKSCSAAVHNMTIQPDGTVLPCQSWPETVGHILDNSWLEIWEHPTCWKLRTRGYGKDIPACRSCDQLIVCGGGCPLDDPETKG